MSRIGKAPISVPAGVTVTINGNTVSVKGKLGELSEELTGGIEISQEDTTLTLTRPSDSKDHRAKHGLYRALVNNMIKGVTEGFTKELELVGVGYRANKGQELDLAIGFSHNIVLSVAPEVKVENL